MSDPATPPLDLLLAQTGWIRRLACRLVADRDAAEDLVQDTVLAALERPPRRFDERALRAWLGSVARNLARMGRRGETARRDREHGAAREAVDATDPLVERSACARTLVEAVRGLEEPYGSIVLLRYYEGLSTAEICAETGLSQAAARKRLSRALALLRHRLDAAHDGGRRAWSIAFLTWLSGRKLPAAPTAAVTTGGIAIMGLKTIAAGALVLTALVGATLLRDETPRSEAAPDPDTPRPPALARAEPREVAPPPALPGAPDEPERRAVPAAPADEARSGLLVRGRVLGTAGAPLPDARVRVRPSDADVFAEVGTDAGGRYEVRLPEPPPVSPHARRGGNVRAEADAPGRLRARESAAVAPGAHTVEIDLVLGEGFEWTGTVRDDLGRPAHRATVVLHDPDTGETWVARSDVDGRYGLPLPGAATLWATAARTGVGFASAGPFHPPGGADLAAPDLVLRSPPALTGVVVTPGGEPVVGTEVRAYSTDTDLERRPTLDGGGWEDPPSPRGFSAYWELGGLPWGSAETDEQGRFSLEGLREGTYLLATGGFQRTPHGEHATGEHVVLIDQHYVVRVRTLDGDGLPLPAFVVLENGRTSHGVMVGGPDTVAEVELTPGSWAVTASAEGSVPFAAALEVVESVHRYEVDAVLDFQPEIARLRLHVADESGRAVDGFRVGLALLFDAGGAGVASVPEERDRGLLASGTELEVPAGRWSVRVEPGERFRGAFFPAEAEVELAPGETSELRLVVRPGGRFALLAKLPPQLAREELGEVAITLEDPRDGTRRALGSFVSDLGDGRTRIGFYGFDGRRELSELLEPGFYVLRIEGERVRSAERPFTVRAGETLELELPLAAR